MAVEMVITNLIRLVMVFSVLLSGFGLAPVKAAYGAVGAGGVQAGPGLGPDNFPDGVNPLTGLAVVDKDLLGLPPAMVSVSNFPVSARPQAGLSFSPYVFEIYIGEGMTRFLALFYGSFPKAGEGTGAQAGADSGQIGPVRSGRVPYESLRKLYNGALVTSGASADVAAQLNGANRVYGSGKDDINATLVDSARLQQIAESSAARLTKPLNLTGNQFSAAAPQGGEQAQRIWVFYNFYNQIEWTYDRLSGAYLRAQDKADGKGTFYPATDRLTGKQLAFQNVVVLFVNHTARTPTIIDLNMLYTSGPALLFRDGQVYPIRWDTLNGEYEKQSGRLRPIRFVDQKGEAFPLKPGQTWVEVVTPASQARELSPGDWKIRFYAP